MTADGREIWRRRTGDWAAPPPLNLKTQEQAPSGQHLNLSDHSLCHDISHGMTKEAVSKLAQDRDLRLGEKQRESNTWEIEEHGFRYKVLFDAGAVVKKKKVIMIEQRLLLVKGILRNSMSSDFTRHPEATITLSAGSGGFMRAAGVRNTTPMPETNLLGAKDGRPPFSGDGPRILETLSIRASQCFRAS
jgi:hypothetical protein